MSVYVSELGNPRGNENPFLLTFGIIWFRWHNFVASHVKRHNPNWSSDKIYNEARKWVIATQQNIVINEWLPSWLGKKLPKYEGKKDQFPISHTQQITFCLVYL